MKEHQGFTSDSEHSSLRKSVGSPSGEPRMNRPPTKTKDSKDATSHPQTGAGWAKGDT